MMKQRREYELDYAKLNQALGNRSFVQQIKHSIAINEAYLETKNLLTEEKNNWPAPFVAMADPILKEEPSSDTDRERIRGEIMQYFDFIKEQKKYDFSAWKQTQANIAFLKQHRIELLSTELGAFDNLNSDEHHNEAFILTKNNFKSVAQMLANKVVQVKKARCIYTIKARFFLC